MVIVHPDTTWNGKGTEGEQHGEKEKAGKRKEK